MAYEPDTDNRITLLPRFDHKEPEDDDMGLPEHPIYSNYSKYLWTSHARTGGTQKDNNSREEWEAERGKVTRREAKRTREQSVS